MQQVTVTPEFRKRAYRSILAIVLFVVTYIILVILAVGLAILCGYASIGIISLRIHMVTVLLALGLFGMGLLIIFFLIKFIFTTNKRDLSSYIEITRQEEPKLFAMIDDVVQQAGTDFPKKVYLSPEINAAVFYNSSFWSMFLPVRKNLLIGVGLMNSVTTDELKGIIAHEFGHFSQRSMKVGSYVYNVNYIIHNMLYQNQGYGSFISGVANISGWLSLPMLGGIKIIHGIQYILQHVYRVVNVNYLALSREMEFHADEVAANIAGPQTLVTSLVRLDFANKSLNDVYSFYGNKIEQNIKPSNIFPQHRFVMHFTANELDIPVQNHFPDITPDFERRFNKSRIEVNTQWASHPSNKDRINRLNSLNLAQREYNNSPAMILLQNPEKTQEQMTQIIFSNVTYNGAVTTHSIDIFESEFLADRNDNTFPKKFNNYFDDHDIQGHNFTELEHNLAIAETELFTNDKINNIYFSVGLENDIKILREIQTNPAAVKSFDFDGVRYKKQDAAGLITRLDNELLSLKAKIEVNDKNILSFYLTKAYNRGNNEEYKLAYTKYSEYILWYKNAFEQIDNLYKSLAFIRETNQPKVIDSHFRRIYPLEVKIKELMEKFIADDFTGQNIDAQLLHNINIYLEKKYIYFNNEQYLEIPLGILFDGLGAFNTAINKILFTHKKNFLELIAGLGS